MELMVVVVLIAILAALAAPGMGEARSDRIAFDYARQYQQILVQGRSRAAGTGAAHLAILRTYSGVAVRGSIRLFAGLDGEPRPPRNLVGPNPVSSCKTLGQWTEAAADPLIANGTMARLIDFVELTRPGVNDTMDVRANLLNGDGVSGSASTAIAFIAICITPSGVTYVGGGTSAVLAIEEMRAATPFTGVAQVVVQRHRAGVPIGIQRRVMITGGGAPRLRSE